MGRRLQWLWLFGSFGAAAISIAVEFYRAWILNISSGEIGWFLLGLTGMTVVLMIVLAIATHDANVRWLAATLIGIVALMFSGLTILSIGILIGPFALALTIASIAMLAWNRLSRRNSDPDVMSVQND